MSSEAAAPPGLDFAVERPTLQRLEHWLGLIVAVPAGAAVPLEVGILLYSVTSRFVFNNPLVWGDELAGMVFLWLAMLGSVLALWKGEHMRLTTIASRLPPRWRSLADTLAVAAPCSSPSSSAQHWTSWRTRASWRHLRSAGPIRCVPLPW